LFLFFFLFPDGRFVPRWTRYVAAVLVVVTVPAALFPDSPFGSNNWPGLFYVLYMSSWLFTGVFAQVYRYRRVSGPAERQQTKWVVFGVTVALAGYVGVVALGVFFPALEPGSIAELLVAGLGTHCFFLFVPLSIGIAILRYRLWDIDIVINRTLVYGVLSASVVGLYALVVTGLGSLLPASNNLVTSLVATGLVAVLFTPLRVRLQRGVNRLMYGERDDPYAVLSRLGRRLETALAPEAALETVAEAVSQALKIPYTAIELRQNGEFRRVSEHGTPKGEIVTLPLMHQSEEVGRMLVSPRAPGEKFSPEDRRLLEDLARQAGAAAHAARLTADLRRSRERLVTAREEERRRLRRDLHDGLGPTLGGLTLGLDAARSTLPQGASTTEALLTELKAQSQEAVSDIRRLVHGLRPPALDDLGLVPAIRQLAAKHGNLVGDFSAGMEGSDRKDGPTFSVRAPENLPPLPAAVEVACYRIAQEAITNVSRHAKASSCRISLVVDEAREALVLEVADDGVGIAEGRRAGVGTSSMRERAEELGGTLRIEAIREGGTRVLGRLPLPAAEDQKEEE
jgi:signal transduction histidine kinase